MTVTQQRKMRRSDHRYRTISDTTTLPPSVWNASGSTPILELCQREDGEVEFRYLDANGIPSEDYNGRWYLLSEFDKREHLRMGGQVAE